MSDTLSFLFFCPYENGCLSNRKNGEIRGLEDLLGYSGTTACLLHVMRRLSQHNHRVYCVWNTPESFSFEGVHYLPLEDLLHLIDPTTIDMFIPVFFLDHPGSERIISLLNPERSRICIMLHCFLNCYEEVERRYAPFKVDVVCTSDFVRRHHSEWSLPSRMTTILNGIPDSFLEGQSHEPRQRPGQWIFFACYERGGGMARRIFTSVRASLPEAAQKMHICSYAHENNLEVTEKDCIWHGSLSKKDLRNVLDECEYFVYPLISLNGLMHHDTFACVIAEALSRGVIVLSLDVACIPSLYGDMVVQVPHIPCAGYDPQSKVGGLNCNILSEQMVTSFKEAILNLEKTPDRKASLRRKGVEWARSLPWSKQAEEELVLRGHLYEVHLWNFSREEQDDLWLQDTFITPASNHDDKDTPTTQVFPFVKLFNVHDKKHWTEYYRHYSSQKYPDHVIIKCDDDVVYIDVEGFPAFIERRLASPHLLVFPSIINNGVAAHYQQNVKLLPIEGGPLPRLPLPPECGDLWDSGRLCQSLHEYFFSNEEQFLASSRSLQEKDAWIELPRGHRVSINCFAILSRDLDNVYQTIGTDDEMELSVRMPLALQMDTAMDMRFVVSHLSFYRQRDTGLDLEQTLNGYRVLLKKKQAVEWSPS